jgi:hypothetical protein
VGSALSIEKSNADNLNTSFMSLRMKVGITQGTNKYKFIGFS